MRLIKKVLIVWYFAWWFGRILWLVSLLKFVNFEDFLKPLVEIRTFKWKNQDKSKVDSVWGYAIKPTSKFLFEK